MTKNEDTLARITVKLLLELEILETQKTLWQLRAKAKRMRIVEVKRQVAEIRKK